MNLITDPLVLRMAGIFVGIVVVFIVAVLFMRKMRRDLTAEASFAQETPSANGSALFTYNAVIQQLKQQKHELQTVQQTERRRAKTSENISAAVLSNLSSGVMFFTPDGMVRQANAAAKRILGFASPMGVTAGQIFREAGSTLAVGGVRQNLAETVQSSLRNKTPYLQADAHYVTPGGEERILHVTLTAVHAPNGEVLGAACLINDQTEVARIRRQQQLRGEISSEMALELHNSVGAISEFAEQLVASSDLELAKQLASDIAAEAAQLEYTIGGFLSGANAADVASAS